MPLAYPTRLPRPAPADLVLGTLAAAFGSLSLTYPFGSDQGLYAYVAREWVERGAIPYRDVFDHKTPGIYVVHALSCVLFGDTMWGIRALDLIGVLAMGVVVARIATPRGERPVAGLQGLSCLLVSILHYGYFDYWNTAQSELWYSLLGLLAIHQAARVRSEPVASWTSGLFAGLTLVMKPPGIWLVAIALAIVLGRSWARPDARAKRALLQFVRFAIALVFPIAMTLAYFAAHHALGAMFDIVVGANGFYVKHDLGVRSFADVMDRCSHVALTLTPLVPFVLAAALFFIARARKAGDTSRLRGYVLAFACLGAALAAVFMQMKFYWLHWVVIVGPLALIGANVARDFLSWARTEGRTWPRGRIYICGALAIALFAVDYHPSSYWLDQQTVGLMKITGRIDQKTFDDYFVKRPFYYFFRDLDDTAQWIQANSTPSDTIVVRGFNPELYILAHRHYGGRFFWTNFLVGPERAYRRADYLAEDEHALAETKPKFAVTLTLFKEGIDSATWYEARGYRVRKVFGAFTVLDRDEPR